MTMAISLFKQTAIFTSGVALGYYGPTAISGVAQTCRYKWIKHQIANDGTKKLMNGEMSDWLGWVAEAPKKINFDDCELKKLNQTMQKNNQEPYTKYDWKTFHECIKKKFRNE